MDNFFESALRTIKDAIEKKFDGNVSKAAAAFGISNPTLSTWLAGTRRPTLVKLAPVLNILGAKISLPESDPPSKEICFVHARVVENMDDPPIVPEDYIAAPLMGEVGAGTGYVPQEQIDGWFLVYTRLLPVQHSRNLMAVEIGAHSTSMQPTLNPRDIVLVDRDDRDISQPGHIMLVLDPMDGSGMIKRVSVKREKDDCQITYYSDNAAQWPPVVYSLNRDFDGEWDKSIVGRVIWAWADMRNK